MPQTRLAIGVLLTGVLQCLLLLLIALTEEPGQVGAIAHLEYPGMLVGGDGAARLEPVAGYGFLFQILMLAQVCLMIGLGVNPARRTSIFWVWLLIAFLVASGVWWQMFSGYEAFLISQETEFVLGFPAVTAWLVYAVWLAGLVLVGLYVFGFKQYVWSDADQAAFDALLKKSER